MKYPKHERLRRQAIRRRNKKRYPVPADRAGARATGERLAGLLVLRSNRRYTPEGVQAMSERVVIFGQSIICTSCGIHLYQQWRDGKYVAEHGSSGECPNSGKAFRLPIEKFESCPELES